MVIHSLPYSSENNSKVNENDEEHATLIVNNKVYQPKDEEQSSYVLNSHNLGEIKLIY